MSALDIGPLPVGIDDRLVGMITDRDIAIRAMVRDAVCGDRWITGDIRLIGCAGT